MSWLRGIVSAALNSGAKGAFSSRPNVPFRMFSDVGLTPAMLDKAKIQHAALMNAVDHSIDRTARTAITKPLTPDELWAQRSGEMTIRAPADSYTGPFPST